MATIMGFILRVHEKERVLVFYACLGISFQEEQHKGGPVHFSSPASPSAVLEIYERTAKYVDDMLLVQVDFLYEVFKKLEGQGFLEG